VIALPMNLTVFPAILLYLIPRPCNPSTTIEFVLPHAVFVIIKIYNILGEEVTTLVSEKLFTGTYKYEWNAGDLASGVYYYRVGFDEHYIIKKALLLK
jgi:hypothetical protein